MQLLIKHQFDSQSKAWSPNNYTVHVRRNGEILCKNGKPDGGADGSISARGWRLNMHGSPTDISCQTCLRILDTTSIETTLAEHPHLLRIAPVSISTHLLTRFKQATSTYQRHFYLAWACAHLLNDDEITTFQQRRLFLPQQCIRLLHLLRDQQVTAISPITISLPSSMASGE